MMYSAPVSMALVAFWSAMPIEIGSNFTANVPPKPQHVSTSFISTICNPEIFLFAAVSYFIVPNAEGDKKSPANIVYVSGFIFFNSLRMVATLAAPPIFPCSSGDIS